MVATQETRKHVEEVTGDYKYGFVSDIEQEFAPKGLSEEVIRFISAKKEEPEWMLEWRLKAYEFWKKMDEPDWAKLNYPRVDYNDIYYYAAPVTKDKPKSLDEVDPEILEIYRKLGIPLAEQEVLAGVEGARRVAVDAVFDSVSVATTFRAELTKAGVIFMSISEAIKEYPDMVKKYLGTSADARQFLCYLKLRGFHRRHLCLYPKGRKVSHGFIHIFPYQRRKYRPV